VIKETYFVDGAVPEPLMIEAILKALEKDITNASIGHENAQPGKGGFSLPLTGHFDLLASFYDRLFGPPDPARLRKLLDLPTPGRLLDVGGGTGRVAQALRDEVGRAIILDISAGMVRQARRKGLTAVRGKVEALPFADGCFSRIIVVDAFHHFRNQSRAVQEVMRVLSSHGCLVIQEPNVKRWVVKAVALGERLLVMQSRFKGPEELADLFEKKGGRVIASQEEGHYLWLIIERRRDG